MIDTKRPGKQHAVRGRCKPTRASGLLPVASWLGLGGQQPCMPACLEKREEGTAGVGCQVGQDGPPRDQAHAHVAASAMLPPLQSAPTQSPAVQGCDVCVMIDGVALKWAQQAGPPARERHQGCQGCAAKVSFGGALGWSRPAVKGTAATGGRRSMCKAHGGSSPPGEPNGRGQRIGAKVVQHNRQLRRIF
jgi:hypothetical protein